MSVEVEEDVGLKGRELLVRRRRRERRRGRRRGAPQELLSPGFPRRYDQVMKVLMP